MNDYKVYILSGSGVVNEYSVPTEAAGLADLKELFDDCSIQVQYAMLSLNGMMIASI